MRPGFALCAVLLILNSDERGEQGPRSAWKEFTPQDGIFAVRLPGEPTEKKQTLESNLGPLENVQYLASSGRVAYMVTSVAYPVAPPRAKALLDGTRDGVVKVAQGRLLLEKPITLGRHPGRELTIEVPLGDHPKAGLQHCRIFLVGRRVYELIAVTPKEMPATEEIEAFFRSFRLLPSKSK
ncbi:MAG: hypothetical protein IRY99_15970 [Isosphaeraceae bacterium]|nr:hypothetical protein [Isosphaeraceae bacterium]